MKRFASILFVVVFVLSGYAFAGEQRVRISGKTKPALVHETPPDQQQGSPLVRLSVDPISGDITFLPSMAGRGVINSSFSQDSAICTFGCGSCPAVRRTVQAVLNADVPVAAGYLVGQLTTGNSNLVQVQVNRKDALGAGEKYIVDVTVDVIDCGQNFSIWFDVCQPGDPNGVVTNACP